MKKALFLAVFLAGCQLLGRAGDIRATKAAESSRFYPEVKKFLRYMKDGKTQKAARLLSRDASRQWQIRLSLMSKKDRRRFLRALAEDTLVVDEDLNRFLVQGKNTPPTRIRCVSERGKRRIEF